MLVNNVCLKFICALFHFSSGDALYKTDLGLGIISPLQILWSMRSQPSGQAQTAPSGVNKQRCEHCLLAQTCSRAPINKYSLKLIISGAKEMSRFRKTIQNNSTRRPAWILENGVDDSQLHGEGDILDKFVPTSCQTIVSVQ